MNLEIPETVGTQPDGTPARNFAPVAGRVVIIGEEPLLEAFVASNRQLGLVLYAKTGTTNTLEYTTTLSETNTWSLGQQVVMTNLFQVIQPVCTTNCSLFFRPQRE